MIEHSSCGDDRDLRTDQFARAMIDCFGPRAVAVATEQVAAAIDSENAVLIAWHRIAARIHDLQNDGGAELAPTIAHIPHRCAIATGEPPLSS